MFIFFVFLGLGFMKTRDTGTIWTVSMWTNPLMNPFIFPDSKHCIGLVCSNLFPTTRLSKLRTPRHILQILNWNHHYISWTGFFFLGALAKLGKMSVTFVMSVRLSAWNKAAPTGRIFMKFVIWVHLENLLRNNKFHENMTRITGTLHE